MASFSYALEATNPRTLFLGSWMHPTFGNDLVLRDFIRGYRILPLVRPERVDAAVLPPALRERVRAYRYRKGEEDYLVLFNHTIETLPVAATLPHVPGETVRECVRNRDLPVAEGVATVRLGPRAMAVLRLAP
jgi:hypothetical protein